MIFPQNDICLIHKYIQEIENIYTEEITGL